MRLNNSIYFAQLSWGYLSYNLNIANSFFFASISIGSSSFKSRSSLMSGCLKIALSSKLIFASKQRILFSFVKFCSRRGDGSRLSPDKSDLKSAKF